MHTIECPNPVSIVVGLILLVLSALAPAAPVSVGPTSKLYLDSYSDKSLYIVQGGAVLASGLAYCNHCEAAIAVDGDIRSMNGGQYRLSDLSQTGVTYDTHNIYFGDGATDGRRNYGVSGNTVYAFDRTWGQQTVLFTLAGAGVFSFDMEGITYDPTNQSLWLQGSIDDGNGGVDVAQDYTLGGTLLSSFGNLGGRALAMDYADGTLWSVRGPTRFFDQYDRQGHLLQTAQYDPVLGFQGGVTGAEFNLAGDGVSTVPEPGTISLAAVALAGALLAGRSRRRKAAQRT